MTTGVLNHKITRRGFLKTSAALGAVAALGDRLFGGPLSTLMVGAQIEGTVSDKWVPSGCTMCHVGRDLVRGHVVNGVLVRVEGNSEFRGKLPSPSLCCIRPQSWPQLTYNPFRVKAPLKRTNPNKGINEDPGFVEISWDEALDTLANKLKEIQAMGLINEQGLPRVAQASMSPSANNGPAWDPFWSTFGPTDGSIASTAGTKCYDTQHLFGGVWGRASVYNIDWTLSNWALVFAKNPANAASHGLWVHGYKHIADAKVRGLKYIQVGPHMNNSAAKAEEWIPIKAGTDTAFLYAMVNVVLHEMDWRQVTDIEHLKKMTNSPYLVGPKGYFARDPATNKPLVWDSVDNVAKVFDDPTIGDFALDGGPYTINAVEVDFNKESQTTNQGTPSFQLLMEHVKSNTPEWAAPITDVPAKTIRRMAHEFVENSMVGSTIEIEGETMPYRPAGIMVGKSVDIGIGAYQNVWAVFILHMLMGSLLVPGGMVGDSAIQTSLVARWTEDNLVDGFPPYASYFSHWNLLSQWYVPFKWPPTRRDLAGTLSPAYATGFKNGWGEKRMAGEALHNFPGDIPDAIVGRAINPVINKYDSNMIRRAYEKSPFFAALAYTVNETYWYADLLLPDGIWSESWGFWTMFGLQQAWGLENAGVYIRQPMVEPPFGARDTFDIMSDLADRMGPEFLAAFNQNNGIMGSDADPTRKYTVEEVMDRLVRTSTTIPEELRGQYGLDYFKEHGALLWPISKKTWYTRSLFTDTGARHELPYQERIGQMHEKRLEELHGVGISWFDHNLEEMTGGLPPYVDGPAVYEEVFEAGAGSEYDLWVGCHRAHQFAYARNREAPWHVEVLAGVIDGPGIVINPETAERKGIKNGDWVAVESRFGRTTGEAVVSGIVRPDWLEICDHVGNYRTPITKDQGYPLITELESADTRLFDAAGAQPDRAIVKIYKTEKIIGEVPVQRYV